jgi:hypothetical protein
MGNNGFQRGFNVVSRDGKSSVQRLDAGRKKTHRQPSHASRVPALAPSGFSQIDPSGVSVADFP